MQLKIMQELWERKNLFALTILFVIVSGFIFRLQFILGQAIYIDEGARLPESVYYLRALTHFPPDVSVMASDPVNPQFYEIIFGILGYILNGFKIPTITLVGVHTVIAYVPPKILFSERLGVLIINTVLTIFLIKILYTKNPLYAVGFTVLYWLNPVVLFDTSLLFYSSIFVPLAILFIVVLNVSGDSTNRRMRLVLVPVIFGMMFSTTYYSMILFLVPFFYLLILENEPITNVLKFYIFFIPISVLTFFLLNPFFLFDPVKAMSVTMALVERGAVLRTASGVGYAPAFFLGGTTFHLPLFALPTLLLLETPLVLIFFFFFGFYSLLSNLKSSTRRRLSTISETDKIGLTSLFLLVLTLLLSITSEVVREMYVLILVPTILIGVSGFIWTIEKFSDCRSNGIALTENYTSKPIHLFKRDKKLGVAIVVSLVLLTSFWTMINNANQFPVYSNVAADVLGYGQGGLYGPRNSQEADMEVAEYINSHLSPNITIISLANTIDLEVYAPNYTYVQLWPYPNSQLWALRAAYNISYIEKFKGDYLVIDKWYSEIWGNTVLSHPSDFEFIYSVSLVGGYSILVKIMG